MTKIESKNLFLSFTETAERKIADFSKKKICIFGAGNTSRLYAKSFEREGIDPVFYLATDSNKKDNILGLYTKNKGEGIIKTPKDIPQLERKDIFLPYRLMEY